MNPLYYTDLFMWPLKGGEEDVDSIPETIEQEDD
jgi:hypothetical protein